MKKYSGAYNLQFLVYEHVKVDSIRIKTISTNRDKKGCIPSTLSPLWCLELG